MPPNFPAISVNADSILKYRTNFENASTEIVIPYDSDRKIILSAITNGATLDIGLVNTTTLSLTPDPDDLEVTFTSAAELNTTAIQGSVEIYVDGVLVGDDSAVPQTIAPVVVGFLSGTIVYATQDISVTFATAPATGVVLTATFRDIAPLGTLERLSFTGAAPLDISAFLKNAPYSFFETNKDIIIRPASAEQVTVAYASVKSS